MADFAEAAQREAIRKEVSRIHESSVYSAQGQFEAAKLWRLLHWSLGVLTAGLSVVAAVITFAANAQVASGVLAVLAALTASALTCARPDKLAELAQTSGNDYTTLRNDARRLREILVPADSLFELRKALSELSGRISDLDHAADPIPRFAYLLSKRNIVKDGGQTFNEDLA